MSRAIPDGRHGVILEDMIVAAETAGTGLVARFRDPKRRVEGATRKWDGSTQLVADIESDRLIDVSLSKYAEEYGKLGEESCGGDTVTPTDKRGLFEWDSLDGTRNFKEGSRDWCVCIAYHEKGVGGLYIPTLAVVHLPTFGDTYWAARGGGAHHRRESTAIVDDEPFDDRIIEVSRTSNLCDFRFLTSQFHGQDDEDELQRMLFHEVLGGLPHDGDYVPRGSAALKIIEIAKGKAEAYCNVGARRQRTYDVSAAGLIVEEAGGRITRVDNQPIQCNTGELLIPGGILITNNAGHEGRCHDEMAYEIMRRLRPEYIQEHDLKPVELRRSSQGD